MVLGLKWGDGKFRDQPGGDCMKCKWNNAVQHGAVECSCPFTHMTDRTCIAKAHVIEVAMLRHDIEGMSNG